jgi:hypothetical protein
MSSSKAPLRFALMLPGFRIKAWQAKCIRLLLESGHASALLVIIDKGASTPGGTGSRFRKYLGKAGLYHAWERFVLKCPTLEVVSVKEMLADIEVIEVEAIRKGKYSDYMPESLLERMKGLKPDFILRFAFNILKGEVLEIPTYGVWSFHHADPARFRGGPPAFWEIYRGDTRIGVMLQQLSEKIDAGKILMQGWFKVSLHSHSETLGRVLDGASSWPARVCRDIRIGRLSPEEPVADGVPMNRIPSNPVFLHFVLKLFLSRINLWWQRYLSVEEWNIGIVRQPVNEVLETGFKSEPDWLLPTGRKQFAADPALFRSIDGSPWVIFEHFEHRRGFGEIHALSLETGKRLVLLRKDYHLAFPRIIRIQNGVLLSAETSASGHWKAWILGGESEPLIGEETVLAAGLPIVDPALHSKEDSFSLFGTLKESDTNTCLHIFSASSIEGPWTPHPANPVITDISSSRMAGPIFCLGGRLIRPAQDSALHYGHRIIVKGIEKIDEQEYRELHLNVLEASSEWLYNRGIHGIDGDGELTLIDAKRYRFSLWPLWKRLRND